MDQLKRVVYDYVGLCLVYVITCKYLLRLLILCEINHLVGGEINGILHQVDHRMRDLPDVEPYIVWFITYRAPDIVWWTIINLRPVSHKVLKAIMAELVSAALEDYCLLSGQWIETEDAFLFVCGRHDDDLVLV